MSVHLCIHGEAFTRTREIVDWIASRTGWQIVSDRNLIAEAGRRFKIPINRLEQLTRKPYGLSDRLTQGARRAMAYLESVVADQLGQETTVFHGFMGLPITTRLSRVLNVLVTADMHARVQQALHAKSVNERQAREIIDRRDRREFQWCRQLFGEDAVQSEDYDLVLPSDRLDIETAGRLILEQMAKTELAIGNEKVDSLQDLRLASKIQVALSESGYPVSVAAKRGHVRLTVDRPVLFLDRLAKKMEQHVVKIKGVEEVRTRVGRNFYQADIYRRCRFQLPFQEQFRCFTEHRQCLYAKAAAHFPALTQRQERVSRVASVQQLAQ